MIFLFPFQGKALVANDKSIYNEMETPNSGCVPKRWSRRGLLEYVMLAQNLKKYIMVMNNIIFIIKSEVPRSSEILSWKVCYKQI